MNDLQSLSLKNIKLIALDLDGTVLTDDKRVTQRTRTAIENAAASGMEIVFVTGRPFFGVPDTVRSIKGVRYVISSNGAVVTDIDKNRGTVHSALLGRQTAAEMIQTALQRDLLYSVYIDGLGYCEQSCFDRRYERYAGTPIGEYIRQSVRVTGDVLGLLHDSVIAPENVWLQEKDSAARDRLHEFIRSNWIVNTVLTSPTDIEIGSPLAGKGTAITWLCEKLGIEKENVLAIGDNFNDLEMFEAAGTAAAMGNAPQGVRSAADFVAPGNEEDGVACVLEKVLSSVNDV